MVSICLESTVCLRFNFKEPPLTTTTILGSALISKPYRTKLNGSSSQTLKPTPRRLDSSQRARMHGTAATCTPFPPFTIPPRGYTSLTRGSLPNISRKSIQRRHRFSQAIQKAYKQLSPPRICRPYLL